MNLYGIHKNGEVIARFVAPLTVRSVVPVFASDTLSLKRKAARRKAHRWEINAGLEPLVNGGGSLFAMFIDTDVTDSFEVIMPQHYGNILSRRMLNITATATGSENSENISVSNTGFIPAGTFIKFANHNKIYATLENCTNSENIRIKPRLLQPVSNTAFKWGDDVIMKSMFELNVVVGMQYTDGILHEMKNVTIIEDLR